MAKVQEKYTNSKRTNMASQMIEKMKRNSSEEAVELIDFKQGNLEFADTTHDQSQDLLWLDLRQEVKRTPSFILRKDMS